MASMYETQSFPIIAYFILCYRVFAFQFLIYLLIHYVAPLLTHVLLATPSEFVLRFENIDIVSQKASIDSV